MENATLIECFDKALDWIRVHFPRARFPAIVGAEIAGNKYDVQCE